MIQLLPLGSVITLKGSSKRLMICGRIQTKTGEPDKVYDYVGCYYPEGIINSEEMILFDDADMGEVFYIAPQDPDEFRYRSVMERYFEEQGRHAP